MIINLVNLIDSTVTVIVIVIIVIHIKLGLFESMQFTIDPSFHHILLHA